MDSMAIGKGLGLAMTKPAETVLCGFVTCCRKEYRELECGPGATTHELILRATGTTSPQRSYMIMVEN